MNGNNVIAGFNNVGYKMKYPDNDNTTIFTVDEGNNTIKKYLKVSLSEDDKTNKYIGIHDDILIPLDTTYSKEGNFITDAAKEAATAVGKQVWKIIATKAVQAIPYVGSIIAGLISGGGTIVRQAAQIVWNNGNNYLPAPENNVNVRSVKLYKNNEVPVMDKQTKSVDLVRQDDPNVPGDDNIVDDEEEPIWAGSTEATFDILEELEYTMTENNDTFTFDIDQYNSDPVVAAAPEGSPRPIGMKRVVIHTNIPSVIPVMDNENPVLIEDNGTYGVQYDDSSNELSIIPVNQNRGVSNVGTFDVNVPSLGELTVTPQSFPYTFSISDYNSSNNTNYVGIRNLTIDYTPSSGIPLDVTIFKINFYNTNTSNSSSATPAWEDISVDINSTNFKTIVNGDYYPQWTLRASYKSEFVIIVELDIVNGIFKLIPLFLTTAYSTSSSYPVRIVNDSGVDKIWYIHREFVGTAYDNGTIKNGCKFRNCDLVYGNDNTVFGNSNSDVYNFYDSSSNTVYYNSYYNNSRPDNNVYTLQYSYYSQQYYNIGKINPALINFPNLV